jgi:pyruvate carboxylase
VRNLDAAVKTVARRKAEEGNESHVAAPMPGSVSTIAVRLGQDVKTGDVVATLEAMKMETVLHAPRDGKIAEILVTPGQQIDARDLLMRLE